MYRPYRPYRTAFKIAAVYTVAALIVFAGFLMPPGMTSFAAGSVVGGFVAGPATIAALITGFLASRARLEWSAVRIGTTMTLIAIAVLAFDIANPAVRNSPPNYTHIAPYRG